MASILSLIRNIYSNFLRWYYVKKKFFFDFFFFSHFRDWDFILNSFKNNMSLIADVFLNLQTPKNVLRWMSKKSSLRGAFDK